MDALKLLCREYIGGKRYDLVDLDPFGSAYDCFDLACKIAKKGLCITLGEMGHKRWRRFDFIRTHYDIDCEEDFIKHQESVNSISFENNQKQDKKLRLIEQDMEIFWNIVKNKDFTKE